MFSGIIRRALYDQRKLLISRSPSLDLLLLSTYPAGCLICHYNNNKMYSGHSVDGCTNTKSRSTTTGTRYSSKSVPTIAAYSKAWDSQYPGLPLDILRSRFRSTFHLSVSPKRHFNTSAKCFQSLSTEEVKKAVERLTDQFMEARELMTDAQESVGTVYFSQDMEEAQEAVKATLDQYQDLLNQLSDEQRQQVLRSIGLKMEELKAQQSAIEEALHDDH